MVLANGAADPGRGWMNLVFLVAAAGVCCLIYAIDQRRLARREGAPPPAVDTPGEPEKPQVHRVSSHPSHETEAAERHWWGAIDRTPHGVRRVYHTVRHIAQTGESPDPETVTGVAPQIEAYTPPDGDPEIDIPLDEGYGVEADNEGSEGEATRQETREEYAARLAVRGTVQAEIVAGLIRHYGVSRATAYRIVGAAGGKRVA